ncbi:MAG: HEPN domain-containing protein [Candidatus Omnitrophica bacterium]|nr:HEPN domain-containing protein [Candidatus Omnitrophota bacterium]
MKDNKFKLPEEWLKQSSYDFETAEALFKTGRYIYTVFMCHLAVEKSLKAFYAKMFKKDSSKTHDLIYLVKKVELELPSQHRDFLEDLNGLSVPVRYPEKIANLLKQYKKENIKGLLNKTRELLSWLRKLI